MGRLDQRVVIVTGGGHGIGRAYCLGLAREGARVVAAVYLRPVPLVHLPFDQLPPAEWDRVMAVNLKGIFLCCRAVAPTMKANRAGKIINISSGTVTNGTAGMVAYVTSKAGVIGLTRVLARELGDFGITANAVAPGLTLSEENPNEEQWARQEDRARSRCLKRVEKPEDLVGTIIFLSSPESDFMTGQTIAVNGGASFI